MYVIIIVHTINVDYQMNYGFSNDSMCELHIANEWCHTFAKFEGRSIYCSENEEAGKQYLTAVYNYMSQFLKSQVSLSPN